MRVGIDSWQRSTGILGLVKSMGLQHMRIISHRGNLTGPDSERENTIEAIEKVLSLGYDVEIDVWYLANSFWLGHDKPERRFDINKLYEWSNLRSALS